MHRSLVDKTAARAIAAVRPLTNLGTMFRRLLRVRVRGSAGLGGDGIWITPHFAIYIDGSGTRRYSNEFHGF